MTGMSLLALLSLSLPAPAAQRVDGDILRITYGDGGTWCDLTGEAGFQTDLDGEGHWRDWVYPGSPWQHLTLAWEMEDASYLYEGNTDYGYWDWDPSVEEDRSDASWAVAYYAWELDDLAFTKTERWARDGSNLLVTITIANTGATAVDNLRYHWQVDPDQDQTDEAFGDDTGWWGDTGAPPDGIYETYIDSVDSDDDGVYEYVQAVGPNSGLTMLMGICTEDQEVGGNNWDTDPDVEMLDYEGEELDNTIHIRQTYATIAPGESVEFGWIITAARTEKAAVAAYADNLDQCPHCDGDGDGVAGDACEGADCNDADDSIYPGAEDTWYDGVDSDCAGNNDYDADGDGFESIAWTGDDCNDADAAIFPGAEDTWYDGVDSDCAGDSDYDADGDGHDSAEYGGDDIDDTDPSVWKEETGDGGSEDGGSEDGGSEDGGSADGGSADGGTEDGGSEDGGSADGGDDDDDKDEGCGGCASSSSSSTPLAMGLAVLGLVGVLRRRR